MRYAQDDERVRLEMARAFPPQHPQGTTKAQAKAQIKALLKERHAALVAHYYTHEDVQEIAEETGGCVSDSLEMARFGRDCDAEMLVVAGVRFMGETAKILSPDKRVIMPTVQATCSLDIGCPIEEFGPFCDQHPDRTVVVYANTSAAVKARADWVCTSSIAVDLVDYLDQRGEKILFAPDKHLGHYVQQKTGADMVMWDGACVVHEEFKTEGIRDLLKLHPGAAILVHPESPPQMVDMADAVGSTTQLIAAAKRLPNQTLVVATDRGIFYKMQQECPDKTFIPAPTGGSGASCRSCAHCPWMAMSGLTNILGVLRDEHFLGQEIRLDPEIGKRALIPLERMVDFKTRVKMG